MDETSRDVPKKLRSATVYAIKLHLKSLVSNYGYVRIVINIRVHVIWVSGQRLWEPLGLLSEAASAPVPQAAVVQAAAALVYGRLNTINISPSPTTDTTRSDTVRPVPSRPSRPVPSRQETSGGPRPPPRLFVPPFFVAGVIMAGRLFP